MVMMRWHVVLYWPVNNIGKCELTVCLALFGRTLSTFGAFGAHGGRSRWLMWPSGGLINRCWDDIGRWLLACVSSSCCQHSRPLCLQPLNDLQLLNVLCTEYMATEGTAQCSLQIASILVAFGWWQRCLIHKLDWRSVFWTLWIRLSKKTENLRL